MNTTRLFHAQIRRLTAIIVTWLLTFITLSAQEFVDQPEDQSVYLDQTAVFKVEPKFGELGFQWLRQWPDRVEVLTGENSSSLTISNAQISDVGHYFCAVSQGEQIQFTRAASLTVAVVSRPTVEKQSFTTAKSQSFNTMNGNEGTVTLWKMPVPSGGSSGTCPGSYSGYVNYSKPVSQGWGWAPTAGATVQIAADNNRTDTKVQYTGKNSDCGCNQTAVQVPSPCLSSKYRFTIFFPNQVPTNAYAITLTGFDP